MSYTCIIFFSMILQHSSWDSSVSSLLEILSCSNLVLSKSESKFSLKCSTSCGSNNIKKNIKRPQLAHPRHETRHRWCAVGSGYKVTISIPCSNVTRTWSCIDRRFSSSSFSFSILLQLACVASYSLVVQLFKGNFQETKVPYNATYHAPGQKTTLVFNIYIYLLKLRGCQFLRRASTGIPLHTIQIADQLHFRNLPKRKGGKSLQAFTTILSIVRKTPVKVSLCIPHGVQLYA